MSEYDRLIAQKDAIEARESARIVAPYLERAEAAELTVSILDLKYRCELWLNHGHDALYGDDGEMQCSACPADFKRQPLGELEHRRTLVKAAALDSLKAPSDEEGAMSDLTEPIPCRVCGGRNVVWFTSNELWNRVMVGRDEKGDDKAKILCPVCFVQRAEKSGVQPAGWELTPHSWTCGWMGSASACPSWTESVGCKCDPVAVHSLCEED